MKNLINAVVLGTLLFGSGAAQARGGGTPYTKSGAARAKGGNQLLIGEGYTKTLAENSVGAKYKVALAAQNPNLTEGGAFRHFTATSKYDATNQLFGSVYVIKQAPKLKGQARVTIQTK